MGLGVRLAFPSNPTGTRKKIDFCLINQNTHLGLSQNRKAMRKPMHQLAAPYIFANAKKLRTQRTPAEIVLWEALREKRLEGFRFRQQHPIDDYILDFYCHFARLAVELDGEYHFTEEQKVKDDERSRRLAVLGIKVTRFSNQMVLHHLPTVLSDILQALIEETYA